jgi:hypothetical protein
VYVRPLVFLIVTGKTVGMMDVMGLVGYVMGLV